METFLCAEINFLKVSCDWPSGDPCNNHSLNHKEGVHQIIRKLGGGNYLIRKKYIEMHKL